MARTVRDAALENRTKRLKLEREERHFRRVQEGLSLCYRRAQDGVGTWSAKLRQADGRYALERLGEADDYAEANGETVLSFAQAQKAAQKRLEAVQRDGGIIRPALTVREASDAYLRWFRAARKSARETENAINAHILPSLGDQLVSALTAKRIRDWHHRLAAKPARKRSGIGRRPAYKAEPATADARRARKATANRVLTVLKAILNKAYRDDLVPSADAWSKVRPFEHADEPITRFLTAAECRRLLNSSRPDLRKLVNGALLTGARFGELAALTVANVNLDTRSVFIAPSKSGKGRHIPLNAEGQELFAALVTGKTGTQRVFEKSNGNPWGVNHQVRPLADACKQAKVEPAITFHELRHTYASLLAQAGADLLTISKLLGHADTRVTARHYAHLCDKTLANAVNALLPSFGSEAAGNVQSIDTSRQNAAA
jgi:integrase